MIKGDLLPFELIKMSPRESDAGKEWKEHLYLHDVGETVVSSISEGVAIKSHTDGVSEA